MAEEEVVDPAVGQEPVEVEDPLPGVGKFQFPDGSWYEGDYITVNRKKKRHGMGMLQDGPESYEGAWVNDSMTGEGQYTFSSGATYTGSFKNGEFEGQGVYKWMDGATYSGEWHQNKMHGKGVFLDAEEVRWEGQFHNGKYYNGRCYVTLR